METLILFAMVLGFLFVGVPVGLSLGLSSILYVALFTTESLSSVAISLFGVGTPLHLACDPVLYFGLKFYVHRWSGQAPDSVCDRLGRPLPWWSCDGIGTRLHDVRSTLRLFASNGCCDWDDCDRGYAAGGLLQRVCFRNYCQRRYARDFDPTLDCHGGLCRIG